MSDSSISSRLKSLIPQGKWAVAAILIGTIIGFASAVICIRWHIAIFGFNLSFVVSPLIAGYVETYVAHKKHGKSTGAISALLIFIIINIYGWFFTGNDITLNFVTLGAIGLTIQAAVPILANYLIFVVFLGTITFVLGYLGGFISNVISKITRKENGTEAIEGLKMVDLKKYGILAVTASQIHDQKITENFGIVSGQDIFKPNLKIESKTKEKTIPLPPELHKQIEISINTALARLMENAENKGANGVIELEINYTDIVGLKGSEIMIIASGDAILFEKQ
jgi:uncharacterized protein YbjQ (UPF0145 family)